jgi:hypothetical protein
MVRGKKQSTIRLWLWFLLQQSVCNSVIKRSIDLFLDFCKVDTDDLSTIFKWVSTKTLLFVCFFAHGTALDSQDASFHVEGSISPELGNCKLVKQYMWNHHRYEVKKEQMMPRHQRSAANSSGNTSQLLNINSNEDEDMNKENDGDENEGGESNESAEDD